MTHVEPLLARRYFTLSPLDTTFHYDPTALSSLFGQHVLVEKVTPTTGGRYLVLAETDKGAYVMARLQENGRPDTTFGQGGIVDADATVRDEHNIQGVVLPYDSVSVASDALGYAYVIAGHEITRFRGNGTRDVNFGRRGSISTSLPLDVEPDNTGGLDVLALQSIDENETVTFTHFDDSGVASTLWSGIFQGNGNATQNPFTLPAYGKIARLNNGKFLVITSREFFGRSNAVDDDGSETGGDADVFYLSKNGEVAKHFNFDTGTFVGQATANADGTQVTLIYGQRQLRITGAKAVRRNDFPLSQPGNLPDGRLLTVSTAASPHQNGITTYDSTAHLYSLGGEEERPYGDGGFDLSTHLDPSAANVFVTAARSNDALIVADVQEYNRLGRPDRIYDAEILRLWTSDGVAASLVSASSTDGTASVTVRYRGKGGISETTIGRGDLKLVGNQGSLAMRAVSIESVADGSVLVRYVLGDVLAGDYDIVLVAGAVSTTRNYSLEQTALGQLTV